MENLDTRWAQTSYKLSYNPYKWPYKRVTGVITLLIGFITQFITGAGPPCSSYSWKLDPNTSTKPSGICLFFVYFRCIFVQVSGAGNTFVVTSTGNDEEKCKQQTLHQETRHPNAKPLSVGYSLLDIFATPLQKFTSTG